MREGNKKERVLGPAITKIKNEIHNTENIYRFLKLPATEESTKKSLMQYESYKPRSRSHYPLLDMSIKVYYLYKKN